MKVHVAIPPVAELYPHGAVCAGLRRLGHTLVGNDTPFDADALVTWSPWNGSRRHALVLNYKRADKPILVVENGWLSPIRTVPFYQIAHDGWNGTGHFPTGGAERWRSWGLSDLAHQPWTDRTRKDGIVLVIGQRGHPLDRRTAMPDWHKTMTFVGVESLRVLRRGPDSPTSLADALVTACEMHVWSSNAASWAVLFGVPVVHHGENLMVEALTSKPGAPLVRPERTSDFERLAWAQWNTAEIMDGEPFERLLGTVGAGLK